MIEIQLQSLLHLQIKYRTISEQEVRDVFENLDTSKAHGPVHISPQLLREGAPILSKPLSIGFNRSLQQG